MTLDVPAPTVTPASVLPPVLLVPCPGTPVETLCTFLHQLGYQVVDRASAPPPPVIDVAALTAGRALAAAAPYGETLADQLAAVGARVILLTRDPRDVLASLLFGESSRSADDVADADLADVGAEVGRWRGSARAFLAAQLASLDGWRTASSAITVRYEACCPPGMGGDEAEQLRTLLGLTAMVGWRGAGLTLARALVSSASVRGGGSVWDEVGAWRRYLDADACVDVGAQAAALATAWGYPTEPPAGAPSAPDLLSGLLAALTNEYENALEAVSWRAADEKAASEQALQAARAQLEYLREASRTLQAEIEAIRRSATPVRPAATRGWLARLAARRRRV